MVHFISSSAILQNNICEISTICASRFIWKGLPQGSVLDPLLYSIYTYDLDYLDMSVNNFCIILQYADDIVLYYSSDSVVNLSFRLNSALHYLGQWLCDNGLSLSINKYQAETFTRKRVAPAFDLFYEGERINLVDKAKFLGIILDSKLNGFSHIEYISKKCEKLLNVLRAVSGVWWSAHPYCLKLIYDALVRSHMDYCLFVLDPFSKSLSQKLDKIIYYSKSLLPSKPLPTMFLSSHLGPKKGDPGIKLKFPEILHQNWLNYHQIYTDASKLFPSNCVGAACWIPKFKIILQFKCPPEISVFSGEGVAILEAILFALSHDLAPTVIFTDSLSCLLAIKENPFRSKLKDSIVFKIREALLSCI
ncbi:uncharacterized protein LOC123662511 [Melitaea cinxia]|uniref:uncharacterized protein LOC123662511 n=1 Tax=Melitaea cinxia TaxID=113334 RepID=UPI001E273DC7|nr:uncharacterized protein LOC123662511 [Melitaea cinxia]